jgi:glycosyltransferase involved in cell wall biosynthesis
MRVVMLTDDLQIDRRILAEAKTIVDAGAEVILIAGARDAKISHEISDGIKIERVGWSMPSRASLLIGKAQSLAIRCLNRISMIAQSGFRRVILFVERGRPVAKRFFRVDVLQYVQRGLGLTLRAILALITGFAILSNKIAGFSVRVSSRFGRLYPRERFVLDKVLFYRPDVIHAHDLPQLRVGVLARDALGARLIYDAHEFYPFQPRLSFFQRLRLRRLEYLFIRRVDRAITVNPLLAREMERHYPEVSIGVIENAIEPPPDFDPEAKYDLFRETYGLPADAILLLYHGWIAPERNLESLVLGMREITDRRIILVLMGYGDYLEDLGQLARASGVADRVMLVPGKPQAELLNWVASVDVGLVPYPYGRDPNTHFASPNKLYEFAVAGVPILTNRLPFLESVIEQTGIGRSDDLQTPTSFARAVERFPFESLVELRARVRLHRGRFLWSHEVERLLEIYRILVPDFEPRPRPPVVVKLDCATAAAVSS